MSSLTQKIQSLFRPNAQPKGTELNPGNKTTGADGKVPQAEKPVTPRAAQMTAGTATHRPLRNWLIELLPAFVQRREARKLAAEEAAQFQLAQKDAELQMSKVLDALKGEYPATAITFTSELKAALRPMVSKDPAAPTHDQLMVDFMSKHLPSDLKELADLRLDLQELGARNGALELLAFVVDTKVLQARVEQFQSSVKNIDRNFFDQASHTELEELSLAQLEMLSDMEPYANSIQETAKNLCTGNSIPGAKLSLSKVTSIAARAADAIARLKHRETLLSSSLDKLDMQEIRKLKTKMTLWIAQTPKTAPADKEMASRYEDVLNAMVELVDKEAQVQARAVVPAKDDKAKQR